MLFYDEKDYPVYLERFKKFLFDFLDVWSYSLLHNHTHYICKTKNIESISCFIERLPEKERTKAMGQWIKEKISELLFDELFERQMNRFLVSYANYLNNRYNRKGNVFQSPFKRIQITGQAHLQQAIIYVNANAQKHGVVEDYKKHSGNSFPAVISGDNYYTDSCAVIDFFGGKEKFVTAHEEQVAYFYSKSWPNSKLE